MTVNENRQREGGEHQARKRRESQQPNSPLPVKAADSIIIIIRHFFISSQMMYVLYDVWTNKQKKELSYYCREGGCEGEGGSPSKVFAVVHHRENFFGPPCWKI